MDTRTGIDNAAIVAIVPCRNEAASIATVIDDLRTIGINRVLVCLDPGSNDATMSIAVESGAEVVRSPNSGYDGPVLAGIKRLSETGFEGHVLFLDAGNKYVMSTVAALCERADPHAHLTFGVRDTQLLWHQKLGNVGFAVLLLGRYSHWVRDVSSLRLMPMSTIARLRYEDREFSLPFQTIVHALALRLDVRYIDIACTPSRTGTSKVSGSWRNSAKAAKQMLLSLFKVPDFDR